MATFSIRINTLLLVLVVLMAGAIIAILATRASGGPLDPPGPPASTPGGIDGRIPISSLPLTITASGSYVVTKNLSLASGVGITVTADNVSIDLNGFTLDGIDPSIGNHPGIDAVSVINLRVVNGVMRRWSLAIYHGGRGGLFHGLQIDSNVEGVALGPGGGLDASIVHSNTDWGVSAENGTTVTNSTFYGNATAIYARFGGSGSLIESNHIEIPAGGIGVVAGDFTTIRRNYFGNPALTGYTTIDLDPTYSSYVVAIENRMKAGLISGSNGTAVIPYDVANALTNISP